MELLTHFQALDALLAETRPLWQPVPFQHPVLPWEAEHPALAAALRALPADAVDALEQDDQARLEWLCHWLPGLAPLATLGQLPELPAVRTWHPPPFSDTDVPGRKWQQILALVEHLPDARPPMLDWCAGKGHLARALAQAFDSPVTCLEINPALCEAGDRHSRSLGLPVRHTVCDVMSPQAADALAAPPHPVALHACGALHRRLLTLSVAHSKPAISVAPCCYHLEADGAYQPFSSAAQQSRLQLHMRDLRLAVQETVTAGQRERHQRERTTAWRLAFDLWQRQQRGQDTYLPQPPIPPDWLRGDFPNFCRHMANRAGLPAPDEPAALPLEAHGWRRLREVTALETLRHAFRRPLEAWLLLDRALFLQEHGYTVTIGTFCPRHLTPRNVLLHARLTSSPACGANPNC